MAPVVPRHGFERLGGVGPVWSSASVGECTVFTGAVMASLVSPDELLTDGDLHGVADDSNLDLPAFGLRPDAVGLPRKRHVPG